MTKWIVAIGIGITGLGAVVYAQASRAAGPTAEALEANGLYQAGFCSPPQTLLWSSTRGTGDSPGIEWNQTTANGFYMRVTRRLAGGWIEADVSDQLSESRGGLGAHVQRLRLNQSLFCYAAPVR